MFCLLEGSLVQSQYELCYISNKCLFVLEDWVFFFLFQVINPVREKHQKSFCLFLFPFSSPVKVGTFFSSRIFPKTTLCSQWGHRPHFLIQWQRLWENSMLLVVQAKRCKWLYWKSICSCEVLLISEFFTICRFALMRVGRRFTAVGLRVWGFIFSPVFSTMSIRLREHLVFYFFALWKKRCVAFFPPSLVTGVEVPPTKGCSCHSQCGLLSEVKFGQSLEACLGFLKIPSGCCRNSP